MTLGFGWSGSKDLELFRERLMTLRASLLIHNDMAKRLAENYMEALKP